MDGQPDRRPKNTTPPSLVVGEGIRTNKKRYATLLQLCEQRYVVTAPIITSTQKFDRGLMRILHDDLHWLDVPGGVTFKLCMLVYKCLAPTVPHQAVCTLV